MCACERSVVLGVGGWGEQFESARCTRRPLLLQPPPPPLTNHNATATKGAEEEFTASSRYAKHVIITLTAQR